MTDRIDAEASSAVEANEVLCDLMEELTRQAQAGESVDVEKVAKRYPEYEAQLRQMAPTLVALADLARNSVDQRSNGSLETTLAEGVLGDFRILREAGRGGMGVVYEASQISLGRQVALKILPLAAVLDQRQLRRFRNEAQAAANLHHPNIVPVYGIGCERGVHYYAMQFIEGQSLDAIIRDMRPAESSSDGDMDDSRFDMNTVDWSPDSDLGQVDSDLSVGSQPKGKQCKQSTIKSVVALSTIRSKSPAEYYRCVARMMIQVAKALDYAHQEGIVHRDIKPSNLIVDADGRIWVTDFGLARIESQPGMTRSGDILGTLGYMSPEQLVAHRGVVDHRSDVYSLGATFYELLTLQPAFDSSSRQAVLRQMDSDEPLAPRKIVSGIPRELETIVLKTLSKSPSERYATAAEVAEDLSKFLDDLPIRAKRPSVFQRLRKWTRRHRAVVATAVAGCVLALVASTIVLFWRQMEAETARRAAVANLGAARTALQNEQEQRAKADSERERAETNYAMARDAVDALLTEVASTDLFDVPRMAPLRRSLLERALTFYKELLIEQSHDNDLRQETGRAYRRVGDIQHQLGHHAEAERAYRNAVAHFQALCDAGHPCKFDLAQAQSQLSLLFKTMGQLEKSRGEFVEALRLIRDAENNGVADEDEIRSTIASIQLNIASVDAALGRTELAQKGLDDALQLYRELLAKYPDDPNYQGLVATTLQNKGVLLTSIGKYQESDKMLTASLELRNALVQKSPTSTRFQVGLALCLNSKGALRHAESRAEQAQVEWKKAMKIWESLVNAHPNVPQHKLDLAAANHNLAIVYKNGGEFEAALEAMNRAQELREELATAWPMVPEYRRGWALGLNTLGNIQRETQHAESSEKSYQQAIEIQRQLAREFPKTSDYAVDLAGTQISLAFHRLEKGEIERAQAMYERAQRRLKAALMQRPNNARTLSFLRKAEAGLAEVERQSADR